MVIGGQLVKDTTWLGRSLVGMSLLIVVCIVAKCEKTNGRKIQFGITRKYTVADNKPHFVAVGIPIWDTTGTPL